MTGTFYECDACGRLKKEPYIGKVELPKDWINIKLQVPDTEEHEGYYWWEFQVCGYECAHRLIEMKQAEREEYEETKESRKRA